MLLRGKRLGKISEIKMAPFSCVLLYSQTTDVYSTKLQAGKRKNKGSPSLYRQWASPTDSQGGTYIKGEFVITLPSLILNVLVKTQISTSKGRPLSNT